MGKKSIEEQINELEKRRNKLIEVLEKQKSKEMKYSIVRSYHAGVFAGYVFMKNGKELTLKNARRIWYWDGAASLSELAVKGTSKPDKCKFPVAVPEITITEVIEIIPTTNEARQCIEKVPEWSKND